MGCPSKAILEGNLTFTVNTHGTDSVAVDADSPPTYRVYEDETATPVLTGTMALLDGDNTVGQYSEQIACTTANGFEAGKSYTVYVSATVDGVTGTLGYGFLCEAAYATASALATVDGNVDDTKAAVTHATYGLSALHTILTSTGVMLDTDEAAALAALVESYMVNETDATALMQAIVDKFAASYPDMDDLTAQALATAVWTNASRTLTALPTGCATEAKQDTAKTVIDAIAADVAGLDGEPMRGTDGANTVAPLDATATEDAAQAGAGAALTAYGAATATNVADARDVIVGAVESDVPADGVEITQATLGTDGEALGTVQPNAKVWVYVDGSGEAQYFFEADADGEYAYKLPEGSTWTLRAVAPRYTDIILEVAT